MSPSQEVTSGKLTEPILHDLSRGSRFTALLAVTKLRNTFRLNAAFSALSGLVGLALAPQVAALLGLSSDRSSLVRGIGAALVVYAAVLLVDAATEARRVVSSAWGFAVGDLTWVAATVAVVGAGALSTRGVVVVAVVALVVLDFGLLQLRWAARARQGLSEAGAAAAGFGRTEVVLHEAVVDVAPARMWPVMTDHELYGRLAANLGSVRAVSEDGPDLVRVCEDTSGRAWRERCTLWDPGRRFAVDVDTAADDYPYPLETMQGAWEVQPAAGHDGSVVTVAFAFRPELGVKARAMPLLMHLAFGPILRRIVRGWVRAAVSGRRAPRTRRGRPRGR